MKSSIRLFLLLTVLAACFAVAQVPRSRYDPAAGRRPVQQKSFFEWAFGQINPRNIDYGARIEGMRQGLLDDTIRDPQWRAKALLIAALLGLYVAYWWEVRRSGGIVVSTARVITAYENELVMARGQITKLTNQYTQAKRILDDHTEMALAMKAAGPKRDDAGRNSTKKDVPPATADNGQMTFDQLLTENNSLKQQVKTLTAKWQEEQQRNRKLKGE